MAKEVKDDRSVTGIDRDELRRVIAEAIRRKQEAAEYSGMHGKVVSQAVERHGIEKNAFTFVRRMAEMEDAKRQSVLRSVIDYAFKLGFFDQLDLFDETVATLETIVNDIRSRGHNVVSADADIREALAG